MDKISDLPDMDRISDLPDDILSYILSKLSIKDMLKTGILSRSWCNLWAFRRDLNFDRHNVLGSKKESLEAGYVVDVSYSDLGRAEFIERVDQFVKNFQGTKIDSFKLVFHLNCEQSGSIDQWINFAISRGVRRIDLLLSCDIEKIMEGAGGFLFDAAPLDRMPGGTTFEQWIDFAISRLRRTGSNIYRFYKVVPVDIGTSLKFYKFPFDLFSESNASNLTSLKLDEARVDETLTTSMLSKCLRLEELKLESCMFESSTLKIASSSLRHLEVILCFYISNEKKYPIKLSLLDCPKLNSFEYHRCSFDSLSINAPVLKRIGYSYRRNLSELPNAMALFATLPRLQILKLDTDFEVLSLTWIEQFKHLRELNLIYVDLYEKGYDILWILTIIQASPHLEKLSVEFGSAEFYPVQKDIKDHGTTFSHNELKVVEMGGCAGNWYELELAVNVLKYAHNLERLVLGPHRSAGFSRPSFQNRRQMIREKLQHEVLGRTQLTLR